jgi:hypothetical protein
MHRQHLVVGGQLHLGAAGLKRIEKPTQALEKSLSLMGGSHLPVLALEEGATEMLLQMPHLVADGRRGQVQLLRSERKALQTCGCLKGAQAREGWKIFHAIEFQMSLSHVSMSIHRLSTYVCVLIMSADHHPRRRQHVRHA